MFALSLLLLTTARALCVDPATVHAVEGRLAPIKATSKADCTSTCAAAGNPYAYYAPGSCYCGHDTVHGGEAVSAPDCGSAYSIIRTYAPAGKSRRVENGSCRKGQMQCNTPTKGEWACVEVNSTVGSCGGCVHGRYGVPESTGGEDCRFVPGVAEGGARCVQGRCQVTSCIDGWSVRESDDGDTACIYHVYGGIFRGGASDEAWVASHISQWALPTTTSTSISVSEVPWIEEPTVPEPEYMDENEVLALIAQVQKTRKEKGERPLPVQIKAAAAEFKAKAAEPPRVLAGVDTADEDTPSVRAGSEMPRVKAKGGTADEDTPSVKKALDTAVEEAPRVRMNIRP